MPFLAELWFLVSTAFMEFRAWKTRRKKLKKHYKKLKKLTTCGKRTIVCLIWLSLVAFFCITSLLHYPVPIDQLTHHELEPQNLNIHSLDIDSSFPLDCLFSNSCGHEYLLSLFLASTDTDISRRPQYQKILLDTSIDSSSDS